MSEFKAGDRVWVLGTSDFLVGWNASREEFGLGPVESIPDSPALPAVACWIAETPDAAQELAECLDAVGFRKSIRRSSAESLQALVAALATDAADGGRR